MKMIHSSDWHLGQHFFARSRDPEHALFLAWLLEQVQQQQPDVIVVAGDIFDTGAPPSYARERYHRFASELRQHSAAPLIIVAGNHDSVAVLEETKSLLLASDIWVTTGVESEAVLHPIRNAESELIALVGAVPFLRARELLKGQEAPGLSEKKAQLEQSLQTHYQRLKQQADAIMESLGRAVPLVLTGHLTVVGASRSDSVRDIYIGTLDAVPADLFPPADYVALGHIHQAQIVSKQHPHIRYCGSPIPLSFDEASKPKSLTVVEFSAQAPASISTVPIPCFRPLLQLNTNIEALVPELERLLARHPEPALTPWLELTIDATGFIGDVHASVLEKIQHLPLELLSIRRARVPSQQAIGSQSPSERLGSLRPEEVFERRLALEPDLQVGSSDTDAEPHTGPASKRQRLQQHFQQLLHEVQHGESS